MKYGSGLRPEHAAALQASTIPPDIAHERGYVTAGDKTQLARHGFNKAQQRVPGLLVPLWSVHGEKAGYQLRPDKPRTNSAGKAIKYETPAGGHNVVDCHPRIRDRIGDPSVPLFITEGAKKADAAIAHGQVCLAIPGVWSWKGRNSHDAVTALGDWEAVALKGRRVYLAFDSDVMEKAPVHVALGRFGRFLESRGADVRYVYLPDAPDGAKVGLDDYLAAGGTTEQIVALSTPQLRPLPEPDPTPPDLEQPEPPPVADPDVAGTELAGLLDTIAAFIVRFVSFLNDHQRVAVTLWVIHTHCVAAADQSPYLHVHSAEKRSGKSRLIEVVTELVHEPLYVASISPAALFRAISGMTPTLLLDEADAIFSKGKSKDETTDSLRGVLNAGARRGAYVLRANPKSHDVEKFSVFCPKLIAGIREIPDTIADRSIPIEMRRKAPGEPVEKWRARRGEVEAHPIRDAIADWAGRSIDLLDVDEVDLPEELGDRAQDAWEPLIAIADLAGEQWGDRARAAAVALSSESDPADGSLGVRLLADIRDVFNAGGVDRYWTADLIEKLTLIEDAPWGDWFGEQIKPRRVAELLRPYGVRPDSIRQGEHTRKGYRRDQFEDAWGRYLPADPEHPEHAGHSVAAEGHVPDEKQPLTCDVPDVPDVPDEKGGVPGNGSGQYPPCEICGAPCSWVDDAGRHVHVGCAADDWGQPDLLDLQDIR